MIFVFDIGTSYAKGGLFSLSGELLLEASIPVSMHSSRNAVFQEIDPGDWIAALKTILEKFSLTFNLKDIRGIVITGNGPTLTAVDRSGKPLCPAMTWLDRRAVAESAFIKEKTGVTIDPSFYLPKILWLKEHNPGVYRETAYFFSPAEFIEFYLTGEAHMIFPGEGLENFFWTPELVSALKLEKGKLPPFVSIGDPVGKICKTALEELPFQEGTPLFGGGPDFAMSILGTGAVVPGRGCDRAGTSEGINICSEQRIKDSRLMSYRHVIAEYWNVTGIISTTGKAVEWYRNEFLPQTSFDQFYAEAAQAEKGAGKLLFLPYLAGERAPLWDTHVRGTFLGLSLHHGQREMTRAVLESSGYAIRDVLEVMEDNGVRTDELRIAGGASKIDLLNQIKADITGKPIAVPEIPGSEITGGLCTALYGLGRFSSLKEASDTLVRIKKVFEPSGDRARYNELFGLYREAYSRLKQFYLKLDTLGD